MARSIKNIVTLRLDESLYATLKELAEREERPLSNQIRYILIQWLTEHDTRPRAVSVAKPARPK